MANVNASSLAAPLPVPPDFPVTWEHSEDERLFWTRDRLHYPEQLTPLTAAILKEGILPGWCAAAAAYDLPVVGPRGQMINTYLYATMVPVVAQPEELAARGKQSEEKLATAMARLGASWDQEWLPEVKQHLAYWVRFDLAGATLPALSTCLDETIQRLQRLYDIHFRCFFPTALAMGLFDDLYHGLFGADDAFQSFALLQGLDNKVLEGDRALWRLSRLAAADPAVRAVLETCDAAAVLPALEARAIGQPFLAELKGFLAEYGARSDKFGVDWPSWIEDPTPAIDNLKRYLAQPERDLAKEMEKLAASREQLVNEARGRLKGYPQAAIDQFEFLLAAAQTAAVLIEEHAFWIDYGALYHVRRLLLEFGRRFAVAGVLSAADDVFFLTLDELRQMATDTTARDRQALVVARQAAQERFRHASPPPALGTPPQGPRPDSPFLRAVGKFFGAPPAPASATPGVLRGSPGSPGKARGPAKIVRRLSEAGKLQPGDVLVAETTLPPWTPLFATAAAVVTDTGGILSHCAVVAREYRIPAVVAVGLATAVLRDGQIVEVDGDAGEVRIVAP